MCLHYIRLSCDFCTDYGGTDRDKSVRRLRGDCTEIVEFHSSHRAVPQAFYGNRTEPVRLRAEAVRRYGDGSLDASESQSVHHLPEYGWLASEFLRYDLKSPRDSRITVSKCPRATSCLSSHGFIHSVLSLRLCRTYCSSRTTRAAIIACSLLLSCLNCRAYLRYAALSPKGSIILVKT